MKRIHLHHGRRMFFRKVTAYLCIILALAGLLISCASAAKVIEEGLAPAEYFQRAQTAMVDRNDYKTALQYYNTFLERFPDDLQNDVVAEYEIAFIHYKTGDKAEALRLFNVLLSRYEGDGAMVLPRWPEVLAKKILEKINTAVASEKEKLKPKSE